MDKYRSQRPLLPVRCQDQSLHSCRSEISLCCSRVRDLISLRWTRWALVVYCTNGRARLELLSVCLIYLAGIGCS